MSCLMNRWRDDGRAVLRLNPLQSAMRDQVVERLSTGEYPVESPPCPVCATSTDFQALAQKDRYGIPLQVCACKQCGLVQSRPHMTQEAYNRFYNEEYRKLYQGTETASEGFFNQEVAVGEAIIRFIGEQGFDLSFDDRQAFVVEVGCGAGGILLPFKEAGHRTMGFDPGQEYVEYGRSQFGLDLYHGVLDQDALPEKADLIIYNQVIEHVLDPIEELIRARDCLSKNGMIYIAIPGIKWLYNSYQMDFLKLLQNAHVWHFTQTSLSNLCKKARLRIVHGTEQVRLLVCRDDSTGTGIESDFQPVLDYLEWLEKERRRFKHRLVIGLQNQDLPLRKALSRIAGKTGLAPLLVKLIYKRRAP